MALFPVGGLEKVEVRRMAAERGLPTAGKAESQEICFVPDGDYAGFVERHAAEPVRAGAVVDRSGRVLGSHAGVHRFTVGQRRGLGVTGPRPLYVLAVRPESATVVAGEAEELETGRLVAREVNWISGPPERRGGRASVKIRYRHADAPASLRCLAGDRVEIAFDAPQRAVTPGQAAVFYDGDVCLGGGWIEA
jgi:tRNA-specific 2-thiouridylase